MLAIEGNGVGVDGIARRYTRRGMVAADVYSGDAVGSPFSITNARAPSPTRSTCWPSSSSRLATLTGFFTRGSAPTAPARSAPSMIAASVSTAPAEFKTEP